MTDTVLYTIFKKTGVSVSKLTQTESMRQIVNWFDSFAETVLNETPSAKIDWNRSVLYTAFPVTEKKTVRFQIIDESTSESHRHEFIIDRQILYSDWDPHEVVLQQAQLLRNLIKTESNVLMRKSMQSQIDALLETVPYRESEF
jgi:hypothetical protein